VQTFEVRAIGTVRSGRTTPEDDAWDSVPARIEIDPEMLDDDATAGLSDFSHLEVVFLFDRVSEDSVCRGARHPRGRKDWPLVGILAQRAKDRPNRLGSTVCRVLRVGPGFIEVQGLDAIEGTPVLDVKPYMSGFAARGDTHEPPWATELMAEYW
jgi:tRNA-Thr(GGU) m(6)t(6)A37 methyltransferase TsaA